MSRSYKKPPKVQPMNGQIMGTLDSCQHTYRFEKATQTYPEIVISSTPHFMAIPHEVSKKPRSKVSSQINRIAGFPAERGADSKDQEKQSQRHHIARPKIRIILQRENDENKDRARHDFGKDLSRLGQEGLRISAKHACSGSL